MKKVLLVFAIVLVALSIMAPGPPDKAEKLKVNDEDWDIEPFFDAETLTYGAYIKGIDCKFGIATAGEHADFTIGITFAGVAYDNDIWDLGWTHTVDFGFAKDTEDSKDEDGYISILLTNEGEVSWNGDDDGSQYFVNEIALALIGPSGVQLGEAISAPTSAALINNPGFPSVKVNGQDWDFDPDTNAIVVPLLANADIVEFLEKEGYSVAVDVDVWNINDIGAPSTFAGSGAGSAPIVSDGLASSAYVPIQPIHAVLDDGVEWNGDDDGNGIVSGTIKLVDAAGNEVSTTTFENQIVGFVIHPEPEPES